MGEVVNPTPETPPDLHSPDDPLPAWLRTYARVMDTAFRVPGTRWQIGVDPLLGLIPVVGDGLSLLLALVPLGVAARFVKQKKARSRVLLRMAGNVLVDAFVGSVPILGDVWDVGFRANHRNLRLLEDELRQH